MNLRSFRNLRKKVFLICLFIIKYTIKNNKDSNLILTQ